MIRNIVFDMGNVLIVFNPEEFMDRVGIQNQEDRRIVREELFDSVEWAQMDMGLETEDSFEPKVMANDTRHGRAGSAAEECRLQDLSAEQRKRWSA